ncbi:hypothetical protein C8R43DRAFT_1126968 [Mycena crocata]|nr:hypothetical protein C8R43DRAFT_1126968 [Mycena crocata]
MSQYNSLQPVHAQRAYDARPQADSLPSNGPTLPFLQPPGIHTRTPNGPGQIPFIGVGIGHPYPFPLPPQPQSNGMLPPFMNGILPFHPQLPVLPQWPQAIVALGPMTPFEAKAIVDALIDASLRGVTHKVALDALHGTQGIPAHVWKDRYLDYKEGFDALVRSSMARTLTNPGPAAAANPPQGSPGAPAPASGKEPVVEQAPAPSSELESQGQPSAHLSRSAAPGSAVPRTAKKPIHIYPGRKQSPTPSSVSGFRSKSSRARPSRSAARTQN